MNNILEYNGFLGSVEYSAADEVFFGRIIGITDHITYDGDSVQKLKRCFKDAVEDYIESCFELGKEPEKSYSGKLEVLVSPDLHRRLIGFSIQRNQPINKTVEEALSRLML